MTKKNPIKHEAQAAAPTNIEIRDDLRGRIKKLKAMLLIGIASVLSMAFKFVRLTDGPSLDTNKNAFDNLFKAFTGAFKAHLVVLDMSHIRNYREPQRLAMTALTRMRVEGFQFMSWNSTPTCDLITAILMIARKGGLLVIIDNSIWFGRPGSESGMKNTIDAIELLDKANDTISSRTLSELEAALERSSNTLINIEHHAGHGWRFELKPLLELKIHELIETEENAESYVNVMLENLEKNEAELTAKISKK